MDLAGLTVRIVDRSPRRFRDVARPSEAGACDRSKEPDPMTVILLHGFGAPGDDLVSLAEVIDAPVRFVFPEAPLELGGLYGDSRAWWLLDLARLEDELRRGIPRDRRAEIPDGLVAARTQVMRLVEQAQSRLPSQK